MTNEMRSMIRLIPLWMILIASLALTFWSIQQLSVSIAKTKSATDSSMGAAAMGGYGGTYNTYCLIAPMYPQLSSSMMPGTTMTKEDQAAMDKYNKDLEKYNADYAAACKADMEKQENASWLGGMTVYTILSLFGFFSIVVSLMAIKRSEVSM